MPELAIYRNMADEAPLSAKGGMGAFAAGLDISTGNENFTVSSFATINASV